MITYKLQKNPLTNEDCSVNKLINGKTELGIPLDEANTDYQEYLKWVAEGNTPEPADE